MNLVRLLVIAWGLNIAASDLPTSTNGRLDLKFPSDSPTRKAFIAYRLCLATVPIFVKATVRTRDPSLPYTFKVTVTDIFIHGFNMELQRTDQSSGWNVDLVMNWVFYSGGNGIMYGNLYIWMPTPGIETVQTRAQSKKSCEKFGGTLLDIMNREMYYKVHNYVNATYIRGAHSESWTGMNFNPTNNQMFTSSGQQAYNGKWRTNYPSWVSSYSAVLLRVKDVSTSGLQNFPEGSAFATRNICTVLL